MISLISESNYLTWQRNIRRSAVWKGILISFGIYSIFLFVPVAIFILRFMPIIFFQAFFAVVFSRFFLCSVINGLVRRPRPYQKIGFTPPSSVFFTVPNNFHDSFPSQHMCALAAICVAVTFYVPLLGIILFAITACTAVARIMLGYHYISDVLAGFTIGLIGGFALIGYFVHIGFTKF